MRVSMLSCLVFLAGITFLFGAGPAMAQDDELTPITLDELIARVDAGEREFAGLEVQCSDDTIFNLIKLAEPESTKVSISIKIVSSVIQCQMTGFGLDFTGNVNFTRTTFESHVNLARSTFYGPVNMDEVTFKHGLTLGNTTYKAPVTFFGAKIFDSNSSKSKGLILDNTSFEGDASFLSITVEGPLIIRRSEFEVDTTFSGASFLKSKSIVENSNFSGETNFSNAQFEDNVIFKDVEFKTSVFEGATFGDCENSTDLQSGEIAQFGSVSLDTCKTLFMNSKFKEKTVFSNAIFEHPVDFVLANFADVAFDGVSFRDCVEIIDTDFVARAIFDGASFKNCETRFMRLVFKHMASFVDAEFDDLVRFEEVVFEGNVLFKKTKFKDELLFRESRIENAKIDMTGIEIGDGKLDLFGIQYETIIAHDFKYAWVAKSASDFEQSYAIDVFSKLETNFRQQSRQTLANEAYFLKRETECGLKDQRTSQIIECTVGKSVGHLVHLSNIITFSLISFAVAGLVNLLLLARIPEDVTEKIELRIVTDEESSGFAFTASRINDLTPRGEDPCTSQSTSEPNESDDKQNTQNRIVDLVKAILNAIRDTFTAKNAGNAIELGFAAFISLRRSSVKSETGRNASWVSAPVSLVVTIEWLLGYFVLFSLGATFANTVPILGELWNGMRF